MELIAITLKLLQIIAKTKQGHKMISNTYKSMTGMQSDTYLTGKLYPKLNAYLQLANGDMLYICSSNQYETHGRFKASLFERHTFVEGSKVLIERDKYDNPR